MKLKVMRIKYFFPALLLGLMIACSNDDDTPTLDFNRSEMLENYASNLIIPAYENLLLELQGLKSDWESFQQTPSQVTLETTQASWKSTYLAWQSANAYNFGPAEEGGLKKALVEEIGVFPVNADGIEDYIAQGATELDNADRDTRGFLGAEYLLFHTDQSTLLAELQESNRQAYLSAVINDLVDEITLVVNAWPTLKSDFISNDGTSVGSSTSLLYNEFVRSYETIKNFKVGLPIGVIAGQSGPEPDLVECRYSRISLEALKAHLQTIDAIYYGKGINGDGIGLHEYLQEVVGGPELILNLEAQWANVFAAVDDLPTDQSLYELAEAEHPALITLQTELQKQTRYFKSDLSSLLGLAITFSSNDGD